MPAIQRSHPDKASKTERWRGFSILWFMGGMLLILASWIWHVLVAMGLAAIVISLVLEQYQTRKPKDRCPFMEAQERA